ncbi:MAG: SAM-dependent DNA methyltransferase [Saprospiraceae bacterium]|nr:SAM-dependent DNA methyltransferase [Saprospiraceae bacterium]
MNETELNRTEQVKSKRRVADHGEVFTNQREVNAMLDLVKNETERIDSRFLEPACGNGNFLAEVLRRKLAVVDRRYKKSQTEWEFYSIIAVSSIYGVDILEDNAQECRDRLLGIYTDWYSNVFKQVKNECIRSVRFLLSRNILWGDALDFTNPVSKQAIVFSEWSFIDQNILKRRDYIFKFLVEKTYTRTLFDENDQPKLFDEPILDFPLIHYLKLGEDDTNKL